MEMSKGVRFICSLWVVLFALFLDGCTSVTTTKHIESASELDRSEKDRAIVFGQIEWLEDGKKKEIGKGFSTMSLEPHLLKLEDESIVIGFLSEEGRFVWSLEAGTYLIKRFAYRDPWSGNYIITPKVAFSVPENGKVYYVGTLKCESEPKRDVIGGLSGRIKFTIQDKSDRELMVFQDKFNVASNKIEKSLMIHDSSIPSSVDSAIELNKAITIINAILYGIPR